MDPVHSSSSHSRPGSETPVSSPLQRAAAGVYQRAQQTRQSAENSPRPASGARLRETLPSSSGAMTDIEARIEDLMARFHAQGVATINARQEGADLRSASASQRHDRDIVLAALRTERPEGQADQASSASEGGGMEIWQSEMQAVIKEAIGEPSTLRVIESAELHVAAAQEAARKSRTHAAPEQQWQSGSLRHSGEAIPSPTHQACYLLHGYGRQEGGAALTAEGWYQKGLLQCGVQRWRNRTLEGFFLPLGLQCGRRLVIRPGQLLPECTEYGLFDHCGETERLIQGKRLEPDGTEWVGRWSYGSRNGQAIEKFEGEVCQPSGDRWRGTWQNGRTVGRSTRLFPNGFSQTGDWHAFEQKPEAAAILFVTTLPNGRTVHDTPAIKGSEWGRLLPGGSPEIASVEEWAPLGRHLQEHGRSSDPLAIWFWMAASTQNRQFIEPALREAILASSRLYRLHSDSLSLFRNDRMVRWAMAMLRSLPAEEQAAISSLWRETLAQLLGSTEAIVSTDTTAIAALFSECAAQQGSFTDVDCLVQWIMGDEFFSKLMDRWMSEGLLPWTSWDPQHPGHRHVMRCLGSWTQQPEAIQWLATIPEQDLPTHAKAWDPLLLDRRIHDRSRGLSNPLQLLAIARLSGQADPSLRSSSLRFLRPSDWWQEEHLSHTVLPFVHALLQELGQSEPSAHPPQASVHETGLQQSGWTQSDQMAGLRLASGPALLASGLFLLERLDDLEGGLLETLTPQQCKLFIEGLRVFHEAGHQPRCGISARHPDLFCWIVLQRSKGGGSSQWRWAQEGILQMAKANGYEWEAYRHEGVLLPELSFLWAGRAPPLTPRDWEWLVQHPERLSAQDLRNVLAAVSRKEWGTALRDLPLHSLLGALSLWDRMRVWPAGWIKKEWPSLYPQIWKRCQQHKDKERLLELCRSEGVLVPLFQGMWRLGLELTDQEMEAALLDPSRFPDLEWSSLSRAWRASDWRERVERCGLTTILDLIVRLGGAPLGSLDVAHQIVRHCQAAPAALRRYRQDGLLPPALQPLWGAGLPMTLPEVFLLFDDRSMRQQNPKWALCVKGWPTAVWDRLLMERGRQAIQCLLNERPLKEWRGLSILDRLGLVGAQEIKSKVQQVPALVVEAAAGSSQEGIEESASDRPMELLLLERVIHQMRKLTATQRAAVRAWLADASVHFFRQERPTIIQQGDQKWLHAHILVPGGGLLIVGYRRNRERTRCQVGWLMEQHNYERLLLNALPSTQALAHSLPLEQALSRLEAPSDEPSGSSSSPARQTTAPAEGSDALRGTSPDRVALLWAALCQDRIPFYGQPGLRHAQRFQQLVRQAGADLVVQDMSAEELEFLEVWLEQVVESMEQWVGAPPADLQIGSQRYFLHRFQTAWSRALFALQRFFPQRETPATWELMQEQLEPLGQILAGWSDQDWPQDLPRTLAAWIQFAEPRMEALAAAGLPEEQWPLQPAALQLMVDTLQAR